MTTDKAPRDPHKLLPPGEAAKYLDVTTSAVRQAVAHGRLAFAETIQLGGSVIHLYSQDELDRYKSSRREIPQKSP